MEKEHTTRTAGEQQPDATNEALAAAAKLGDREALAALWEQNRGLLGIICRRYYCFYERYAKAAGITPEDVEQEGYFIICKAVEKYDPERGAQFSTMLGLIVRSHLQDLVGLRKAGDPLNRADSLDEPVNIANAEGNTEGDALGERVPDPGAAAALLDIDEHLYTQCLHKDLEDAMEQIPGQQADTLRKVYWQGYSRRQLADSMECSIDKARAAEYAALAALRRKSQGLRRYLEEIRTTHAYRGTGFSAWAYGGSVEERILERIERATTGPQREE